MKVPPPAPQMPSNKSTHTKQSYQQIADDQPGHDKTAGTVKPLNDEEKKTLAELLRRDRQSKPVASK